MMKNNDFLALMILIIISLTIVWGASWSSDVSIFVGNFFIGSGCVIWLLLAFIWLRKVLP